MTRSVSPPSWPRLSPTVRTRSLPFDNRFAFIALPLSYGKYAETKSLRFPRRWVSSYRRCFPSSLPSQTVPAVNKIGTITRFRRWDPIALVDEDDDTWYILKKISNIYLLHKRSRVLWSDEGMNKRVERGVAWTYRSNRYF